jgi:signal transduction histidine kinase
MSVNDEDYRRLMSLVAHELRSPGAVVAGYLRLLQKNTAPGLSEPERKMIDEANKSCGRLMHIAQQLSELAELTSGDSIRGAQPVRIFELCEDVARSAAESGTAVSFSMARRREDGDRSSEACVDGHAGRLRQALALLVTVMGRERGASALNVTGGVSGAGPDSRAVLIFGDSIEGDLNAVAGSDHPFDRWRGGSGLSLLIAYRIVEAHRGGIRGVAGARGSCIVELPLMGSHQG